MADPREKNRRVVRSKERGVEGESGAERSAEQSAGGRSPSAARRRVRFFLPEDDVRARDGAAGVVVENVSRRCAEEGGKRGASRDGSAAGEGGEGGEVQDRASGAARDHFGLLAQLEQHTVALSGKYSTPLRAFLQQLRVSRAPPLPTNGPPSISISTTPAGANGSAAVHGGMCGPFILQKDTDIPGGDMGCARPEPSTSSVPL
ncbi:hypothetical protein T484DRAFT_1801124 [Baffinella frigidus]|nr:hypothetical protein T484DRAFT_1801124 [Cryptophyta sp. CCMP2293]